MNLLDAEAVLLSFGKHADSTLKEVAGKDLLYLDWLLGQHWLRPKLKEAIALICEDRRQEIEDLLQEREARQQVVADMLDMD